MDNGEGAHRWIFPGHGDAHKRPGPAVNPDSARQVKMRLQETNKRRKFQQLLDNEDCVWVTSSRGGLRLTEGGLCCSHKRCSETYMASEGDKGAQVTGKLRRYYHSLTRAGKRSFQAARISMHVPARQLGADLHADLHGKQVYTYTLEAFPVLRAGLLHVDADTGASLPAPVGPLVSVCQRYFVFAIGAHNDTTYQQASRVEATLQGRPLVLADLDLHQPQAPRRTPAEPRTVELADSVVLFLAGVAEDGLHLPDCDRVILPWPTRKSTHASYVRSMEAQLKVSWADDPYPPAPRTAKPVTMRYGNQLCGLKSALLVHPGIATYRYFCHVWDATPALASVVLRKWLPFAKCDTCIKFRGMQLRWKKLTRDERAAARAGHRIHIMGVRLERRAYYSNRMRARLEPHNYLSLIIDGADQGKHRVPHWPEKSHMMDEAMRQQLYAYGVLSHGRKAYTYLLPGHVRQGHDVTIDILWRVLCDTHHNEGKLPPVLLLQLDNTTKQNKGRYLFAFLALLVHHNIFDKIVVSFLPVGHTHEDIDQMFSRFAEYLRCHCALSPDEMARCMRSAFTYCDQPVHTEVMDTVAGMSRFLAEGTGIALPECMDHRHFRIRRDGTGKVILQARSSPIVSYRDEPWQGLRGNTNFHDMFPTRVPTLWPTVQRHMMPAAALPTNPLNEDTVLKIKAGDTHTPTHTHTHAPHFVFVICRPANSQLFPYQASRSSASTSAPSHRSTKRPARAWPTCTSKSLLPSGGTRPRSSSSLVVRPGCTHLPKTQTPMPTFPFVWRLGSTTW